MKFSNEQRLMRGITLAELLVATTVAALLALAVAAILNISLKYWKTIDAKAEVQLNAMLGIEAMKNEMNSSNIGSFTVNAASFPKAVGFQSAFYNNQFYKNADGAPSWQTYVVYYLAANSTDLVRREIYSSGPIAPLTPAALTAYCTGAGNVKAMDVTAFNATLGANYIELYLKTQLDYGGKENSTNITTRVYPRN